MEIFFKPLPSLTIKLDAKDEKELFEKVGNLMVIFEDKCCGLCQSSNIRLMHRKVDKYDYYEMQCTDCYAKLAFGNDGKTLFPRRYKQDPNDKTKPLIVDGQKVWLDHKGWFKWTANSDKTE